MKIINLIVAVLMFMIVSYASLPALEVDEASQIIGVEAGSFDHEVLDIDAPERVFLEEAQYTLAIPLGRSDQMVSYSRPAADAKIENNMLSDVKGKYGGVPIPLKYPNLFEAKIT